MTNWAFMDIIIFLAIAGMGYWIVSAVLGRLQGGRSASSPPPPLNLPQHPIDEATSVHRTYSADDAPPDAASGADELNRCPNPECRQINMVPGSRFCARCGARL